MKNIKEIDFIAGHLAVDFVNTVDSRKGRPADDYLWQYGDLVEWATLKGILDRGQSRAFAAARGADAALRTAVEFREALYRLFSAAMKGQAPGDKDLAVLNRVLSETSGLHQVVRNGNRLEGRWNFDPAQPTGLLGPVAAAAADLLQSDQVTRVKECPPPDGCGWLFLDTSRNGRRTWCSMKDCGNAAKVRRFRRRARTRSKTATSHK